MSFDHLRKAAFKWNFRRKHDPKRDPKRVQIGPDICILARALLRTGELGCPNESFGFRLFAVSGMRSVCAQLRPDSQAKPINVPPTKPSAGPSVEHTFRAALLRGASRSFRMGIGLGNADSVGAVATTNSSPISATIRTRSMASAGSGPGPWRKSDRNQLP